jgi:GntR family transcriptional regulator/MocR family aminotransferase
MRRSPAPCTGHPGRPARRRRAPAPTRDFARSLGCSRNIVLLAYEQLVLEGYLDAPGGRHVRVAGLAEGHPSEARGAARTE